MLSFLGASSLVAVMTPDAGTHVTKRPQQCWAVSLSAVNACLSTGRQHPPRTIEGRATKPYPAERPDPVHRGAHKVTGFFEKAQTARQCPGSCSGSQAGSHRRRFCSVVVLPWRGVIVSISCPSVKASPFQ